MTFVVFAAPMFSTVTGISAGSVVIAPMSQIDWRPVAQ
jgi:hypothetical protein